MQITLLIIAVNDSKVCCVYIGNDCKGLTQGLASGTSPLLCAGILHRNSGR